MISLETPQRKLGSSRLEGRTSWIFSSCAGALDLRLGPQGPALVASGKASPHASCSGASRDFSPIDAGSSGLVWSLCGNLRIPLSADMDLAVFLESPQGSQSSSRVGACTCAFLPSCSNSVTLPFPSIKGSVAFPRGFPTRLSHRAVPRATVM